VPAVNKAQTVRRVFDSVAERYDVMNDLMSLGLHRLWKSFTISVARPRAGERVLDIATGSGDLAAALARRVLPGGEVWITDINRRMLERGRDRLLDLVRGREAEIFDRAIDNLVSRLRKKIEEDAAHPQLVKTVWGGGYTLACEVKRLGGAA